MNALVLQRILLAALFTLIVGTGFGFAQLAQLLTSKVVETDHARIDADLSDFEITKLKKLSSSLVTQKDVIDRAHTIVADGRFYNYQDQIIADLTAYAGRSGVTISGFDFSSSTKASTQKSAGSTTPNAASAGGKKVSATISLKSPLPYDNFMRFITQVEANVTKIQIVSVNLSPEGKDPRLVNNPSIGIELYIKS